MASSNRKDIRIFNQHLKFSWSHIISFLGLIAAAYIIFMGFTYMTGGSFIIAGCATAAVVLSLAFVFIGAQQLKATDHKFDRSIRRERIMLCLTPYALAIAMWPVSHFWAVRSHDTEIVRLFTESIGSSRQLFSDYETYSSARIGRFDKGLRDIVAAHDTLAGAYRPYINAGFKEGRENIQIDNMVLTLREQLRSENYRTLRDMALRWIDEASHGASTWNIFLIGNTQHIEDAVTNWHETLNDMSDKEMCCEHITNGGRVDRFADTNGTLGTIVTNIRTVSRAYRNADGGVGAALIFGALLYLMLLFPYLIQGRNTRSMVTLWGRRQSLTGSLHNTDSGAYDIMDEPAKDNGGHRHVPTDDDDEYIVF